MINPPDELLADLQSALPPEMEKSPQPGKYTPVANGGGYSHYDSISDHASHTYESADHEDEGGVMGYEMPRSSAERSVSPQVRGWGVDVVCIQKCGINKLYECM